jgi:aerobic-type carbon monoxide dehydrogenase small subunit (CoxS/CutS family)
MTGKDTAAASASMTIVVNERAARHPGSPIHAARCPRDRLDLTGTKKGDHGHYGACTVLVDAGASVLPDLGRHEGWRQCHHDRGLARWLHPQQAFIDHDSRGYCTPGRSVPPWADRRRQGRLPMKSAS